MQVRIDGRSVSVLDRKCPSKPCFWLGFDKGVLVRGQGYRYRTDAEGNRVEHALCWRRHQHGCPTDEEG